MCSAFCWAPSCIDRMDLLCTRLPTPARSACYTTHYSSVCSAAADESSATGAASSHFNAPWSLPIELHPATGMLDVCLCFAPSRQAVHVSVSAATEQPKHEPAKEPAGRPAAFSGSGSSHVSTPLLFVIKPSPQDAISIEVSIWVPHVFEQCVHSSVPPSVTEQPKQEPV